MEKDVRKRTGEGDERLFAKVRKIYAWYAAEVVCLWNALQNKLEYTNFVFSENTLSLIGSLADFSSC